MIIRVGKITILNHLIFNRPNEHEPLWPMRIQSCEIQSHLNKQSNENTVVFKYYSISSSTKTYLNI